MYAALASGAIRRNLVAADLNIPDSDDGACGLHATGRSQELLTMLRGSGGTLAENAGRLPQDDLLCRTPALGQSVASEDVRGADRGSAQVGAYLLGVRKTRGVWAVDQVFAGLVSERLGSVSSDGIDSESIA
jgi:hypothetical protein